MLSIYRGAITGYFVVADGIRPLAAGVAGVAFDSINSRTIYSLDDAYVVQEAVLTAPGIPIEEDDVARFGGICCV